MQDLATSDVKSVMKCLLHTIMFHRALGPTPPRDALMDRFNITYVQCGDLELEKEINDRVDEFCVHLHDSRESSGQMRLLFYEKRQQSYFWKVLGSQDDKVCWEEWILPMRLVALGQNDGRRRAELADQIHERIQYVVKTVTDKKDHIPPVPKELTGTTTFYHEIKVISDNASNATLQAFKGMSSAKLI